MSSFDAQISVVGMGIGVPNEFEPGEEPYLELSLTVGLGLPIQMQPGAGPLIVPVGKLRAMMGKEKAIELFKEGLEQAEKLPKPSNLTLASNLSAVEQAANKLKDITGQ